MSKLTLPSIIEENRPSLQNSQSAKILNKNVEKTGIDGPLVKIP